MSREHTHTRTIDYDAVLDGHGGLRLDAKLCDLRRLTFTTSIRGAPAKPGLIHDVELDLTIDRDRVVRESRFRMYSVPFADSSEHEGHVCRAIEPAFVSLEGVTVDDAYTRSVVSRIGGPRGCFHGLALAIGAGPVVESAFAGRSGPGSEAAGFGRHLLIDGFSYGERGVTMSGRLQDSVYPVRPASYPTGEILREVVLEVSFEVGDFSYHTVSGGIHESGSASNEIEVEAILRRLEGLVMGPGIFTEARRRIPSAGPGTRFLELLGMMIPVTTQAAMRQLQKAERPMPGVGGSMAQLDSCHMWAKGGPLDRRVQALLEARVGKRARHGTNSGLASSED